MPRPFGDLLLLLALLAWVPSQARVQQDDVAVIRPTALEGKVMIIYDSSGSMAGEVRADAGGARKYEVARREFGRLIDLLGGLEVEVEVGLMAYGHRRRGDCQDIELLSRPESNRNPAHRERLKAVASRLETRGKTPVAASIVQAARALRYTEERAIVVLISDGIEECGGDPCAAAAELERTGTDFTAHVVGFDLDSRELAALQCVARDTGGQVLAAENASALARSIEELARKIAREEWQRQQGRAVFTLAVRGFPDARPPVPAGAAVTIIPEFGPGQPTRAPFLDRRALAALPPGPYRATLELAGLEPRTRPLTVEPAQETRVAFELEPARLELSAEVARPELFADWPPAPVHLSVERVMPAGGWEPLAVGENSLAADLPPGTYRATASYLDLLSREETIELALGKQETLAFSFGPAKLEARAVNQDGAVLSNPALRWRIEPLDREGPPVELEVSSVVVTLPPARYRVTAIYATESAEAVIEAIAEVIQVVTLTVFEPR